MQLSKEQVETLAECVGMPGWLLVSKIAEEAINAHKDECAARVVENQPHLAALAIGRAEGIVNLMRHITKRSEGR